jgi:SAM-dependent methyltransferase
MMASMSEDGWQAFFDADAAAYDGRDYAAPWREVLDLPLGARIVDLGCGTGRHAVAMAARGFRIVGVDFSAGMLARAGSKAQAAGVRVDWIQADLTRFAVGKPFDGAICMLEAGLGFMAVGDDPAQHDLAVLRNARAALRPGARLLLGVSNGYRAIREYSQEDIRSGRFDPVTMLQEHDLAWAADGVERTARVRYRPYLPPEIAALMEHAGFRVEHIWGGTHGRGPIQLDDHMITVVARTASGPGRTAAAERRGRRMTRAW